MVGLLKKAFPVSFLAVVLALMATTANAQAPKPTPTPDFAGIYRQYVDAVNRGDAAGAAAFFAEDGVFIVGGCPADTGCVGRAAIQARTARTVAGNFRFAVIALQVSGNTLTAREEHRAPSVTAAGIERVVAKVTLTFRGDKIARRVQANDLSDSQTAAFVARQQAQPPAAAPAAVLSATAEIKNAQSQVIGSARFDQDSRGVVRVRVEVRGLPSGQHGIHIHAVGKCDPPDFTSAGGHHNPLGKKHGLINPEGPHAGDLPVLVAAADGTARYETTTDRVTLSAGPTTLFDADGSALVIHVNPDDQTTDPTGNAGARIACGLIQTAPAAPAPAALPRTGVGGAASGAGFPAASLVLAALGGLLLTASAFWTLRRRRQQT